MWELIIWLIIAVALVAVDLLTSSFIFMWFSIGAIAAIILSLLGFPIGAQIAIFLITGIICMAFGYPWAKKKFKAGIKKTLTMEEEYIGNVMVANEDMGEKSKIKVGGIYWTAYNKGATIKKGQSFMITGIEGNKLIVNLKED